MGASLPHSLYRADQVRNGERKIAADLGVEMYTLMESAGLAAYQSMRSRWPAASKILVLCGGGNNGGDGYVIARLAIEAGLSVTLWSVVDPSKLTGDALTAKERYLQKGGAITRDKPAQTEVEVVVDALLGTGLCRTVTGAFLEAVKWINQQDCSVLAVDIPSGLDADTGAIWGEAVHASVTVTFVALKQGLFTGQARARCGECVFDGLGIGEAFESSFPPAAIRVDAKWADALLPPRSPVVHKGNVGRVLCIGGQRGMGGAVILCGQAALRTGAGLVALLTDGSNLTAALSRQPELMTREWDSSQDAQILTESLAWADVLALGPGLGQSEWSKALFAAAMSASKPMVVDADALNLLAASPRYAENWVLTPHPGEAAKLLSVSTAKIEQDRFSAVKELQKRYGGVVVLKGAGTIVYDGLDTFVIHAGNPGMASGGMGDVLTGVIASALSQTRFPSKAATFGTFIHSFAADNASQAGERGLLASDLLPWLGKNIKQMQC